MVLQIKLQTKYFWKPSRNTKSVNMKDSLMNFWKAPANFQILYTPIDHHGVSRHVSQQSRRRCYKSSCVNIHLGKLHKKRNRIVRLLNKMDACLRQSWTTLQWNKSKMLRMNDGEDWWCKLMKSLHHPPPNNLYIPLGLIYFKLEWSGALYRQLKKC